jgi:hypothetical protein
MSSRDVLILSQEIGENSLDYEGDLFLNDVSVRLLIGLA